MLGPDDSQRLHTAPLEQLTKILKSMHDWLQEDDQNVAAVHCLAGKGRAGTVCAAYLMYSGEQVACMAVQ